MMSKIFPHITGQSGLPPEPPEPPKPSMLQTAFDTVRGIGAAAKAAGPVGIGLSVPLLFTGHTTTAAFSAACGIGSLAGCAIASAVHRRATEAADMLRTRMLGETLLQRARALAEPLPPKPKR